MALAAWHRSPANRESVAEAETRLREIVKTLPNTEIAASALLDLGRIAESTDFRGDIPDLPAARAYYQDVRARFPETDMSTRATLYLTRSMVVSFDRAQIEEAASLLEKLLEEQSDPRWIGITGQYLAHIYYAYLNEPENALAPYLRATEAGLPRKSITDLYLWELGLIAEKAGRPVVAARIFTRIVEDFPRSTYGTIARERVAEISGAHPEQNIPIPEIAAFSFGNPTTKQ